MTHDRGGGPAVSAVRIPEQALGPIAAACEALVRADAASIAEAGEDFQAAIGAITAARTDFQAGGTVPWSEFRRMVQRAGKLLGGIDEWQRHRRARLFPGEPGAALYGANGQAVAPLASGSMTLEG